MTAGLNQNGSQIALGGKVTKGEEVKTVRIDDSEKCLMRTTPEPRGNDG